jgi:hypothetical protein
MAQLAEQFGRPPASARLRRLLVDLRLLLGSFLLLDLLGLTRHGQPTLAKAALCDALDQMAGKMVCFLEKRQRIATGGLGCRKKSLQ